MEDLYVKEIARKYVSEYKLNVLPTAANDKRPGAASWKEYQTRSLSKNEIESLFGNVDFDSRGMGIVCGKVSGNLEVLDFDNKLDNIQDVYKKYSNLPGVGDILERCVVETTQHGGFHVYYRCSEIAGCDKLACMEKPDGGYECVIETRGEGGFCVCAPSKGYELRKGDFGRITDIAPDERDTLFSAARSLSEKVSEPKSEFKDDKRAFGKDKPWDLYDADPVSLQDAKNMLIEKGWTHPSDHNGQEYWLRPGKDHGNSATFRDKCFYVFSSNALPFEPSQSYRPSGIYAALNYGAGKDDFRKAVKDFIDMGYGDACSTEIVFERCQDFFSYGANVMEAAMVGDSFYFNSVGKEKFLIAVGAENENDKKQYFQYLVRNKHLKGLNRIDYVGKMEIEKSTYAADLEDGVFTAAIKGINEKVQDNALIESFLSDRFGRHKEFIKKWLAIYCYTNYRKLPVLILTGERGTGKNTFAEAVGEIFKSLSDIAGQIEGDFNPSAEKKLMIIDESDSHGKLQYQTLKKISGQKTIEINKKYMPQYQAKNNLNIILLSNELLPVTVERDELPTDEANNQFFVYRLPKLTGPIDADLQDKIIDRLGYYIRTELKMIFDNLDLGGCRYSLKVPITEDEKELFNNSISDIEVETDRMIDLFESRILNSSWSYFPYVKNGYLPSEFFDEAIGNRRELKPKIIQMLKEKKYLENSPAARHQAGSERKYCQKLGKKWLEEVQKVLAPKKNSVINNDPFQGELKKVG